MLLQSGTAPQRAADDARDGYGHVRFVVEGASPSDGHDVRTKAALAGQIAELLGIPFREADDAAEPRGGRPYCVPCATLTSEQASKLGIASDADLFGGVAPQPFVATKVITHPLWREGGSAPAGWSPRFSALVRYAALDGFSVFSAADALAAGEHLLRDGAVRVKPGRGVGGAGQTVVTDRAQLLELVERQSDPAVWRDGWVLERHLERVQTCSVGQVRIGRWLLSYHGRQRLTHNHHGQPVYGGSTLHVVRGDFTTLLQRPMSSALRLALYQALLYHRLARTCYPGHVLLALQLRCRPGLRCPGPLALGRARAILAHRRRQRCRTGGASLPACRPRIALGPGLDARDLRRGAHPGRRRC